MAKHASKTRFSKESGPGGLYGERESMQMNTRKSLKNQAETDNLGCLILEKTFQGVCIHMYLLLPCLNRFHSHKFRVFFWGVQCTYRKAVSAGRFAGGRL